MRGGGEKGRRNRGEEERRKEGMEGKWEEGKRKRWIAETETDKNRDLSKSGSQSESRKKNIIYIDNYEKTSTNITKETHYDPTYF